MPQGSGEVMFVTLILGTVIFTRIALSAGVAFLHRYEHRRNNRFTSQFLSDTNTDSFLRKNPKKESIQGLLTARDVTSVSELGQIIELESVENGKIKGVQREKNATEWRGCCIMLFVWVAMGIAGIWLLRPFLAIFLCYALSLNCT